KRQERRQEEILKAQEAAVAAGYDEKAPGKSRRCHFRGCKGASARHKISNEEKYDHGGRADHQHITYILAGHRFARPGRAFHDMIVFNVRHCCPPPAARRRHSKDNAMRRMPVPAFRRGCPRMQFWSVRKSYPSSVTLSRDIFLCCHGRA